MIVMKIIRRYLPIATGALAAMAAIAIPASAATAAPAAAKTVPIVNTGIWNGYLVKAPSGNWLDEVQANWKVPKITGCTSTQDASTWIGLGGATGSPLVQIGTDQQCEWFLLAPHWRVVDQPFYEVIQGPGVGKNVTGPVFSTHPISAGNSMQADVFYNPDVHAGYYVMQLKDVTRGWTWTVPFTTSKNTVKPGTAEWVVENGEPHLGSMAHFGTFTFTSCFLEFDGIYYGGLSDSVRGFTEVRQDPPVAVIYPVVTTGSGAPSGKIVYGG